MSPYVQACPPTPAADAVPGGPAHGSTLPQAAGRHWGPLRREVTKLLFQRRTYLIWGGLLAIPFLVSLAIYLAGEDPHEGGDGPQFLVNALTNGLYVPLGSLAGLVPFLLPLSAAMVASYMVAGEAELGTLRIILLRPVARGAVLLTKLAAAMLYLFVGLALVYVGGIVFGGAFFGIDDLVTLSGTTVSIPYGLWLIFLAFLFALAAMACVVSLSLVLSTVTDSSLTALIGTEVVIIVVQVLISFSYFDWLKPYVFPNYLLEWANLFRDPIYWRPIGKALLNFALTTAGLTTLAWYLFRRKDVLS